MPPFVENTKQKKLTSIEIARLEKAKKNQLQIGKNMQPIEAQRTLPTTTSDLFSYSVLSNGNVLVVTPT